MDKCIDCKSRKRAKHSVQNGKTYYKKRCSRCHDLKYSMTRRGARGYRRHVKEKCEFCGFIPIHVCQLDVDHKDGNHKNNSPENLQTLCANCHRLKTQLTKDFQKKSASPDQEGRKGQ